LLERAEDVMAKRFFYVCAGLAYLALAYHFAFRNKEGDDPWVSLATVILSAAVSWMVARIYYREP
jgi:hypothetical protein